MRKSHLLTLKANLYNVGTTARFARAGERFGMGFAGSPCRWQGRTEALALRGSFGLDGARDEVCKPDIQFVTLGS